MCCVLADVSSIMFGRWFLCFLSLICPKRTGDKQGRMIMTVQVSLVRHFENFQTRFPVLLGKKKKGMSESLRSHSKILLRGKFSKGWNLKGWGEVDFGISQGFGFLGRPEIYALHHDEDIWVCYLRFSFDSNIFHSKLLTSSVQMWPQ